MSPPSWRRSFRSTRSSTRGAGQGIMTTTTSHSPKHTAMNLGGHGWEKISLAELSHATHTQGTQALYLYRTYIKQPVLPD